MIPEGLPSITMIERDTLDGNVIRDNSMWCQGQVTLLTGRAIWARNATAQIYNR